MEDLLSGAGPSEKCVQRGRPAVVSERLELVADKT